MPLELAPLIAGMLRQARLGDWSSDQIAALTYGRAMDTTRFVTATGLKPRFTSRQALEEFVGVSSPGLLSPERVDQVLSGVTGLLEGARRG